MKNTPTIQISKEKRGNKVHSGEIEMFGQSLGYKASSADRRARDLVEEYRTVKGVREPNPYYCPDIKSTKERGAPCIGMKNRKK